MTTFDARTHTVVITADGGCTFGVRLAARPEADAVDKYLGTIEVGEIGGDDQWEGAEADVTTEARNVYGIPTEMPIELKF
jgi:hypothetical protein